jgi:dTDP-glucose 4,6-dehydratase
MGFIGSNFIRRQLLETVTAAKPELVVCLDKLAYAGNPQNLADLRDNSSFVFVQGDIGDEALVAATLEENQITGVVNFAAESHVDRSIDSPETFIQTNVVGTLRLLEASRHYWSRLAPTRKAAFRFLHVSTDEVYGTLAENEPAFTEKSPYSPRSPYAASKAGSDHLVSAYHHTYGLPVVTSNCSNNYGPYQFPEKLIPLIILNAIEQKPLPVYGDGGQIRDWLHVADHCDALRLILEQGRLGEVYLIGGSNEIRNLDLVHHICTLLDELRPLPECRSHRELIAFVEDRPGHDRRYAVNNQKLRDELGWQPRQEFHSGLRATVLWYLAHQDWCADIQAKTYQRNRLGLASR